MKEYITSETIISELRNLRQVVFEVTEKCNLNCKYCGYGELYNNYDNRKQQHLQIDKGVRIIDYLVDFWQEHPNISRRKFIYIGFYGGEPLVNFEFIKKIVNYIKTIKIPYKQFQFNITTNGVLLDRYMDFLVENNFAVLISLDGNKSNNSYRINLAGKNSYDKVLENIELLRNNHTGFFTSNVNFNAVLHNRNSAEEITDFFRGKFNKRPSIGELNTVGIAKEKKDMFLKMFTNKNESIVNSEQYEKLQEDLFLETPEIYSLALYLKQYSGNFYNTYNDLFIDENDWPFIPTGTCLPFGKKMFVTTNGKILPCERLGHTYALGQITDTEIQLDFEEIANNYNKWYARFESQCKCCFIKKGCTKCMFTVDNLNDQPVCNQFMNESSFDQYTKKHMEFLRKKPQYYKKIIEDVIIE
jgi:uncharacterized protein